MPSRRPEPSCAGRRGRAYERARAPHFLTPVSAEAGAYLFFAETNPTGSIGRPSVSLSGER